MKSILIDTNIAIDLLAQREPFYKEASLLFSLADESKLKLYFSSLSFANTNYILEKASSPKLAREILKKFKLIVSILDLNEKLITLAINDQDFLDFEDGLQYYTALENKLDLIITRNRKDFKNSRIPVMNAKEFLSIN
ncbi:MAG: PIN domain-containing protein [Weeksellaceae bacterium]|jgi:predicted nucleic acid-binding protein|nr:PIN domain-containing protein [Weeksellaceae bacterium]